MPFDHTVSRRDLLRASAGFLTLSLLPASARSQHVEDTHEERGPMDRPCELSRPVPGWAPLVTTLWVEHSSEGADYGLFKRMVEGATDFSWLSKGDRVLIKLALNSGNSFPATTDPWLLCSTIRLLKEKGAGEVIVGDQAGVQYVHWTRSKRGSTRALSRSAGLLKIIEKNGALPCFFEERGYDAYVPVFLPEGSHWNTPIWMTSILEDVDHVVYLPRVSSHVLGDITAALKIAVGFLREDSRLRFHQGGEHFYAMYEEVNIAPPLVSRFRLGVVSGRRVLSTFGPDNGHVTAPARGLVAASNDLVALELLSYAWLVWNRCVATPGYARATTGNLTRMRSAINQGFVWYVWRKRHTQTTPVIPFWQAGSVYGHPSLINAMKRKGGRPETIQ